MKTLNDWFCEGATKVRLPKWNEWAYLEISGTSEGLFPWAYLYDVGCNGRQIFILDFGVDTLFEKWIEPDDFDKRKDEIYEEIDWLKEEI